MGRPWTGPDMDAEVAAFIRDLVDHQDHATTPTEAFDGARGVVQWYARHPEESLAGIVGEGPNACAEYLAFLEVNRDLLIEEIGRRCHFGVPMPIGG